VTTKSQMRDPIIFEALYLHNSAKWTHGDYGPFIVNRIVSWLTMSIV